ncbi:MAG: VWA domain-containing protein, partial [Firmicutes bacterium]|nr:VWA domain-containing protein [Bacillota bacterium]
MNTSAGGGNTRLSAAKSAINNLANTLLSLNGQGENPADAVEMALVTFGNTATTRQNPTTSASTFTSSVNGITIPANVGTNWEAAMQQGNTVNFNDNDQTFVIFVSDGNPTFRYTEGNYPNHNNDFNQSYYNQYGVWGTGSDNNATTVSRCYDHAVDDAAILAQKVGVNNFYTIGAYGSVDRMQSLTTEAGAPADHYFSATNTTQLQQALASILEDIQTAGIGSTTIKDPTTTDVVVSSDVTAHLLTVDDNSFKYYRNGVEWPDAPEAELDADGNVIWDLKSVGILDNNVTYTVTFDVWPSQETYDMIADLENGVITYSQVPEAIQEYLIEDDGSYTLKTNKDFPTITYKDTRVDNEERTVNYENPKPVPTAVEEMDITKYWFNDIDWRGEEQYQAGFTMEVLKDGDSFTPDPQTVTVKPEDWTDSIHIATGLMRVHRNADDAITGIEVLETGHDYTLREPANLTEHWELVIETIHPMLINGELHSLVQIKDADIPEGMGSADFYTLEGVDFYRINGKVYEDNGAGNTASASAYNERKSNLNIKKVITGNKEMAPEDAKFTYTITVTDRNGDDVWFSVMDEATEEFVTDELEVTGATAESGNTGYFYAPSGGTITLKLKEGWNLRFMNLPTYSTYTVEESSTMDPGFVFDEVDGETTFKVGGLPDGAVDLGNDQYTYDGVLYTKVSDTEYTAVYNPTITGMKVEGKVVSPNAPYQVTYANQYVPTKVAPKVTKAVSGYDSTDTFTFSIAAADDVTQQAITDKTVILPDPATVSTSGTIADGTTQEVQFGDITFTRVGTYKFEITETFTTEPGGWTYDASKKDITVTVDTDTDGKLKATVTGDNPTFTNTYEASGEVTLAAKKALVGRAWQDGESYTFTLSAAAGTPMPAAGGETATYTADGAQSFGKITYGGADAGKTYTYTISETSTLPSGITKSSDITATVVLTDNGSGEITAAVTYSPESDTITNTYTSSGSVELTAKKALVGREWQDGETYTFTLYDQDGTTVYDTKNYTADGEQTFKAFTYTQDDMKDASGAYVTEKTLTYKISETSTLPSGVSKSGDITATVVLTDDGEGHITGEVTYDPESDTITNTYVAEGEAEITVTKAIAGAAWPAGKTLTLTIEGAEGAPMPGTATATLSAAGNVTFGPIAYDESDAGKTYTYTITESNFGDGWSGSPASITATVVVTDNGDGTLATAVSYNPANATFTNTYAATGSVDISVTKELIGRDWIDDETFTFTLTGNGVNESKVVSEAAPTANFTTITYDESDVGQTYVYTVSETSTLPGGITKSGDVTVTVVVSDNGDGTLEATATYTGGTGQGADTITNTYESEGSIELEAIKELEGREWQEGETYTFTLKDSEGNVIDEQTVSADTKVTFDKIEYTEEDMVDENGNYVTTITYEYTIEETTTLPDGMTNSGSITATVTLTDDGEGNITAEVEYTNDDTIVNTYESTGEVELKASKELIGRAWQEGEEYVFTLSAVTAGAPMPAAGGETATYTADGEQAFGKITYTQDDMLAEDGKTFLTEKTYTYTISETSTLPSGVTKSGDITATVTVTDNGDGTLGTSVIYSPENDKITNTYTSSGSVALKAKKELVGREWQDGETYTFTLYEEDGTTVYDTKNYTADGEQTFKAFTYTQDDMKDDTGAYVTTKTLTYTISETSTLPDGITKSGDITATVVLTDDGEGNITGEVTYDPESDTITNTYEASGTATLSASKALTGRAWQEGEEYTFTLSAVTTGAPMPESGTTATYTADGSLDFGTITYSQADAGKTYEYKISETSDLPAGITKSGDITATVTVTDNGDGTLATSVTYDPTNATIINTYEATGSVEIKVNKELIGRDWIENEQYTFTLKDAEGNALEEKTVDKDNLEAAFTAIPYTEADAGKTFTYTVEETSTLPGGITNSGAITVSVEVTDNGNGTLATAATYTDAQSAANDTITNKYDSEGSVELVAIKELEGREWQTGETYTFTLKDSEGNVIDEQTVSSDSTVVFDKIEYTEEDMVDENGDYVTTITYEYTIEETTTMPDGMTNSGSITATVTLTDDGEGNITAEVEYSNNDTIVNTYESTGEAQLKASKALVGRAWQEGEEYVFTLSAAEGTPMPASGTTITYTADGEQAFGKITYTQDDMLGEDGKTFLTEKTYTYTISETS